jgi:hypothetical protein
METIKIPEQTIVINDQANIDLRQILQALNIKFDCDIINSNPNPNKTVAYLSLLVNERVYKKLFKAYNIPGELSIDKFIQQFPKEKVGKIRYIGGKAIQSLTDALEFLGYDY